MFGNTTFERLGLSRVRVVVPWDAALTDDPRSREWIESARARGSAPLVAFEYSRSVVCPGASCAGPTPAAYRAGIAAFRQRWPQVTDLTPWNEPNHNSQPTYMDPALAAQYYNAARAECPECRLVAGDFLDDGNLSTWLASYRQGLVEEPAVWGLHNYFDATYFTSAGADKLLRSVSGEVWLTETGGIVRFGTLAYDETRAADAIRWLYAMARSRARITRMYLYHWQWMGDSEFDAGLVGSDGTERLGLAVVREELARPPEVAATHEEQKSSAGQTGDKPLTGNTETQGRRPDTAVRVRLSGKSLRLLRRGLRVELACVAAPSRCTGRVVVRLPRRAAKRASLRLPMSFDLRPGQSVRRVLRVSAAARSLIARQRKLQVTYCLQGAAACRTSHRAVERGSRK
jgi:hypothetical protein